MREDALSYQEEEVASLNSQGRASGEGSLVGRGRGSGASRLRNIVTFTKKREEEKGRGEGDHTPLPLCTDTGREHDERDSGGAAKLLKRLANKSASKKKEKEDLVEFKLVEDLRLITIPITTCLLVLFSYIIFGAVLFSAWEVTIIETTRENLAKRCHAEIRPT